MTPCVFFPCSVVFPHFTELFRIFENLTHWTKSSCVRVSLAVPSSLPCFPGLTDFSFEAPRTLRQRFLRCFFRGEGRSGLFFFFSFFLPEVVGEPSFFSCGVFRSALHKFAKRGSKPYAPLEFEPLFCPFSDFGTLSFKTEPQKSPPSWPLPPPLWSPPDDSTATVYSFGPIPSFPPSFLDPSNQTLFPSLTPRVFSRRIGKRSVRWFALSSASFRHTPRSGFFSPVPIFS